MSSQEDPVRRSIPTLACVGAIGIALMIGGCGGTDPTPAVDKLNDQLSEQTGTDTKITCPDDVDDDSTPFDCTVEGPGGEVKVQFKLDGDTLDVVDQQAYGEALVKASGVGQ